MFYDVETKFNQIKIIFMKQFFTLFLFSVFCASIFAQERYTEEIFTDGEIKVTENVNYATNATILALLFNPAVNEFVPEPLFMDVYEPDTSVDTETDRPMVMIVHGGDGLPIYANNTCFGDKLDSVTVNTARKLARMGYVAVAPNYRLGWNPLAPTQDVFLDGLVDAAARVSQDLRACARYLRKDIAENGNNYNIHSEKFGIWGTATTAGTYAAFTAYINELEEVQSPTYFVTDTTGNIYNVFNEMEVGNLDGTVVGINAAGDTTNYVNTPNYSNAFQITAVGSAISLDAGVIDADEPPMIMFGNPNSKVTSVPEGPIQLPSTGEVVAFVQLSQGLIKEANDVGVNSAWENHTFTDQYSLAQQGHPTFGEVEGWLPLHGDPENEYPWVHWDPATCSVDSLSQASFPGMDRDYALAQIDTMAGYFGVRACISLGLNCPSITSIKETLLEESVVDVSPNPVTNAVRLVAKNGLVMQSVEIYNTNLQLVNKCAVNHTVFYKDDLNLSSGIYAVLVRFEKGIANKKIVVIK